MISLARAIVSAHAPVYETSHRGERRCGGCYHQLQRLDLPQWLRSARRMVALGSGKIHYSGTPSQVDSEWASWCCHYRGEVIYVGEGVSRRGLRLDGLAAVGFFVQPQAKRVEHITVSSGFGAQGWTFAVDGRGGAQFVGIIGIDSTFIAISDSEGGGFAFGDLYFVPRTRAAGTPRYSQHL